MSFKDNYGSRFSNRAVINHARGIIANKLKVAAEAEIQKILGEVEQRIRTAIGKDIQLQVGDLMYAFGHSRETDEIRVVVHVVSTKSDKADDICISHPDRLRP